MPRRKTLKLSTPEEARRAMSRIANMVLNGEIDTKTANTLLFACNSVLGAIRTDEYKQKVELIEMLYEEQKKQK